MFDQSIIPLFPLPRVLFPKMILPLHIFEDRYKEMVRYCLERGQGFGVLADESLEVGAVGVMGSIHKVVKKYADGRYDLLVLGGQRFRIMEAVNLLSFPQGHVELIEDAPTEPAARDQVEEMLNLYRNFISRLALKNTQRQDLSSVLDDLDEERDISYIIGQTIGMDAHRQTELLAVTSPEERVQRLTGELQRLRHVHQIARNLFEGDDFDPSMN